MAGSYLVSGSAAIGTFVLEEVSGEWGEALELQGMMSLNTVSSIGPTLNVMTCASPGNCLLGGDYGQPVSTSEYYRNAFVAEEVNGVWGNATEVPGFASLNTGGDGTVLSISCPSGKYCVAGGIYSADDRLEGFIIAETNGVWGKFTTLKGIYGSDFVLASVTCTSSEDCVAIDGDDGSYESSYSTGPAHIYTEFDRRWTEAAVSEKGLKGVYYGTYLSNISCAKGGYCVAVGWYTLNKQTVVGGVESGGQSAPLILVRRAV